MAEFDRMAYVTIQGGAVYGLSLLGQLQAVLDRKYDIVAIAGTSAGAIVATLHWAGLSPENIRDKFVELVGPGPDGVLRILSGGDMSEAAAQLNTGRIDRVREAFTPLAASPWYARPLGWIERAVRIGRGLAALPGLYRTAWRKGGLFTGASFETLIDDWIRTSDRIPEELRRKDGLLTFGDLWDLMLQEQAFFPVLIVTATNLSTCELLLIDSTDARFFDVPVARAVRASGGFPLFFRPVEIDVPDLEAPDTVRRHSFCDGGVMCNFPAFVRRVREAIAVNEDVYLPFTMRPWVNIGLRMKSAPRPRDSGPLRSVTSVAGSLVGLVTAGTRTYLETTLAEETVDRLTVSYQPFTEEATGWPHSMLQFDKLTPESVRRMFEKGRGFAGVRLRGAQFELPPPEDIEPRLGELMRTALAAFGEPDNSPLRLRVSLFVPQGSNLVLRYRHNFDPADQDSHLSFEYNQGLAGFCFVSRRPALCNLQRLSAEMEKPDRPEFFGLPDALQARVREGLTWLFSMPVFDPLTAKPYSPEEAPDLGVPTSSHFPLESPIDGGVFGVLGIDGCLDYAIMRLADDPEAQLDDPRIQLVRDALLVASGEIGKTVAAYYAWAPPEDIG